MKHKKLCIRLMLAGAIFGLVACGPKSPEERSARIQKKVTNKLELNETQAAEFKKVADALVAARQNLRSDRAELYEKTEVLLASENLSPDQILQLVNPKIEQVQKEVPKIAELLANFHKTLNPEQRKKLVKFVAKVKKHHMKH
ncbi:MAG: hypothetical protein CL677_00990 [Bdellovibrionaceae bacterium]|nr:hypothetical protein [Pseudobdellovibrionaceae bacterium]|tara:strand:- start:121005 stop:121433 length:429 start_codon:yes stop_codon:yes gene_type:complete